MSATWPAAFANYHALQVKLERRLSGGLYALNSFVYSKAIDNVGQALEAQGSAGRSSPQNFFDLRAEKAVSDFDQTFNNTTSIVYELPFGRGRSTLRAFRQPAITCSVGGSCPSLTICGAGNP